MATSFIGPYSPEYYKKNTLAIPQLSTAAKTSTVPYAVKPATTIQPTFTPSPIPNASALTLNMGNLPTGNAASTAAVSPSVPISPISSSYVPNSATYLTAGQYGAPVLPQDEPSASSTPTPAPEPAPSGLSDIQNQINITKDALESAKAQLASMQSSSSSPSSISSAQSAVTTAENAYKEALKLSPDEITTQEDLDKLIEATKKSYLNIKGQAIPLEFITGQLKSVEERALGLAEPLESKLARLQAKRTAAIETSKFDLERADKAAEANKPTTVSEGTTMVQFNPSTGKYENVYTAPKTLSPSEQYGTGTIGEYNYYASQEKAAGRIPMSFNDYQTYDANRKAQASVITDGGLTTKQTQNFLNISNKYQADEIMKTGNKGVTAIAIADQVLANPNNAGNQLQILYTLVKNLDPDSAVREGELSLATQTQSFFGKFSTSLEKIGQGKLLSATATKELATATKNLAQLWYEAAERRDKQYMSQAKVAGVGDAFNQYLAGFDRPYSSTNQGSSGSDMSQFESE